MSKKRGIPTRITMILMVVSLICAFPFAAQAAPDDIPVTILPGATAFTIDIVVNEATPYAGIQFALSISDESAVTFSSFTMALAGSNAAPFQLDEDGLHSFGFYAASNLFPSGERIVGTINFTNYTGNQALSIVIEQMEVIRLTGNLETITTPKPSPVYVFAASRDTAEYFTVTFDMAGGNQTGGGALVQSVVSGGAALAPILVRSGYTFEGWDKPFNEVTSDMTVTAQWKAIAPTQFTVTFDPAGGTRQPGGGLLEQIIPAGGSAIEPIVTRVGYNFEGWDKPFTNVMADITVTALWKEIIPEPSVPPVAFTVTFNLAGGTHTGGGPLVQTIEEGKAAQAPTVTREGYTFDGWDPPNFSNVTSNMTVTAKWTLIPIKTFTVTFDPDGGILLSGDLVQTIEEGEAATAPVVGREGFTFAAWDKEFSEVTEDITVTALWEEVEAGFFTVIFDAAGGILSGEVELVQVVAEGEDAIEPTVTREGYTFEGWDPEDFTNITADMTVTALWKAIPKNFTVTFDLDGGTLSSGTLVQTVEEGKAATAPTATRSGYTFDSWDKTFSNITEDITVTAKWTANPTGGGPTGGGGPPAPTPTPSPTPIPEEIEDEGPPLGAAFPFTDVLESNWFYGDVYYMWEHELMNGTSATLFSPNDPVRRGMVVTVLYRMEGEPDVSELENPFDDVADGMYYTDAVTWAADKGIVLGYSETEYGPNDNVTREQLAAILFRYQTFMDKIPPDIVEDVEFADEDSISGYALEPVYALVAQGVINGKENNMFDPKGNATRAEFAAMLHRYLLAIEDTSEE